MRLLQEYYRIQRGSYKGGYTSLRRRELDHMYSLSSHPRELVRGTARKPRLDDQFLRKGGLASGAGTPDHRLRPL